MALSEEEFEEIKGSSEYDDLDADGYIELDEFIVWWREG